MKRLADMIEFFPSAFLSVLMEWTQCLLSSYSCLAATNVLFPLYLKTLTVLCCSAKLVV